MDKEKQSLMLIVHAGDAKSKAFEAISKAKTGQTDQAKQLLKEANEALTLAHTQHTDILQNSCDDLDTSISMLMAHAQDHLMSASVVLDLAKEICDLYSIVLENFPTLKDKK